MGASGARRALAVVVVVVMAAGGAGCRGADPDPASSATATSPAGSSPRPATSGGTGPGQASSGLTLPDPVAVGTVSTLPSTGSWSEANIADIRAVPTHTNLPCQLTYHAGGLTDQLRAATLGATPPGPPPGAVPLLFAGRTFPLSSSTSIGLVPDLLSEGWAQFVTSLAPSRREVLARVDPATGSVGADRWLLEGGTECRVTGLATTPDGTAWVVVCAGGGGASGLGWSGSAVVPLRPGTTIDAETVGLAGVCPHILAVGGGLVLVPGEPHRPAEGHTRLWRIDPGTGAWLTVDSTAPIDENAAEFTVAGDALWYRQGAASPGAAPTMTRFDGATLEPVGTAEAPAGAFGAVDGALWAWSSEGHRFQRYDDTTGSAGPTYPFPRGGSAVIGPHRLLVIESPNADGSWKVGDQATVSEVDPSSGAARPVVTLPAVTSRNRGGVDEARPPSPMPDATGIWIITPAGAPDPATGTSPVVVSHLRT